MTGRSGKKTRKPERMNLTRRIRSSVIGGAKGKREKWGTGPKEKAGGQQGGNRN